MLTIIAIITLLIQLFAFMLIVSVPKKDDQKGSIIVGLVLTVPPIILSFLVILGGH